MKTFLKSTVWLPKGIHEIFAFFGDAASLQAITPNWLSFEILTPQPVEMRPGAIIDYKLKIRGFPVRLRTEITPWEPPYRFVDER